MSLTEALDVAGPGDTIALADGLYREPIVTMNAVSHVFGAVLERNTIGSKWRLCVVVFVERRHTSTPFLTATRRT